MSETERVKLDQIDFIRRQRLALSRITTKQKAFCEEWVRSFNKILAMKVGGYSIPKHTKGGAQQKLIQDHFDKIMESEAVQEYILLLEESIASRLGVSMDAIVDEYKAMAFTNIDDYIDWDNTGITSYKSSTELTRAQKAGIVEITETTTKAGKTIKIKLHNKQSALDRLFEILKELEEHEKPKEGPAKVSQTQINVMLQDPLMRRAIEYLADGMFDRPISLVGNDKDRRVFEEQLAKITKKLTGGESGGIISGGHVGGAALPAPGGGHGEKTDPGDHGNAGASQENELSERQDQHMGKEEINARIHENDEENGNRYPVDGL